MKSTNLHNRVISALSYDPLTGVFLWKPRTGRGARNDLSGMPAGASHKDGYVAIQIGRKKYLAHRLAWLISKGEMPKNEVDHINGDRKDNRLCNLRDVTKSVNLQNQRKEKLGVDFNRRSGKWRARITVDGVCKSIGYFEDENKASQAYLRAKRELHEGCTL